LTVPTTVEYWFVRTNQAFLAKESFMPTAKRVVSLRRKANPAPYQGPTPNALKEIAAALSGETARCMARSAEHAIALECIATQFVDATHETFADMRSTELFKLSHRMRGMVLNALSTLAELQCIAGRIESLAMVRATEPWLEMSDDLER
jgi:hypothetical protein